MGNPRHQFLLYSPSGILNMLKFQANSTAHFICRIFFHLLRFSTRKLFVTFFLAALYPTAWNFQNGLNHLQVDSIQAVLKTLVITRVLQGLIVNIHCFGLVLAYF